MSALISGAISSSARFRSPSSPESSRRFLLDDRRGEVRSRTRLCLPYSLGSLSRSAAILAASRAFNPFRALRRLHFVVPGRLRRLLGRNRSRNRGRNGGRCGRRRRIAGQRRARRRGRRGRAAGVAPRFLGRLRGLRRLRRVRLRRGGRQGLRLPPLASSSARPGATQSSAAISNAARMPLVLLLKPITHRPHVHYANSERTNVLSRMAEPRRGAGPSCRYTQC